MILFFIFPSFHSSFSDTRKLFSSTFNGYLPSFMLKFPSYLISLLFSSLFSHAKSGKDLTHPLTFTLYQYYSTYSTTMTSFVSSAHQAAGHDGCLTSEEDGSVFAKLTLQQEIEFYTKTHKINEQNLEDRDATLGASLIDWMPIFMGTLTQENVANGLPIEQNDPGKKYIVLQNLYHGFSMPSILDIKLGSVLFDETASAEKQERMRQVSKTTTSGSLGFRVCGMKVYRNKLEPFKPPQLFESIDETVKKSDNGPFLEYTKHFGRNLNKATVEEGIRLFFHELLPSSARKLATSFHRRLQLLYNCMIDSNTRMIAASLLFIYENDELRWGEALSSDEAYEEKDPLLTDNFLEDSEDEQDEDGDDKEVSTPLSRLNLIDFAHSKYVDKNEGPDENVLQGLELLLEIFEKISEESRV